MPQLEAGLINVLFELLVDGRFTLDDFAWVRVVLASLVHVVLLLIAAWDLTAAATNHPELSVSALTQRWAIENPVLPLAVGVIMGHLFWPIQR